MNEDTAELRRYVETGSEDAFAGIVRGYLPLVYGAALRRVGGDVHRAEDVTQLVFTALARNAASLVRHPELTGWLFTTTRFLAAKTLRSEQRRQAREQEVYHMQNATNDDSTGQEPGQLQPVLDDVMMELRQLDRQILLLRFYRGLRLAEIGTLMNVTENAVQKRLERALDQMKDKLSQRGITSTATALVLALEQQSLGAVPAGLAGAATSAGLACGGAGAGATWLLNLMTISKIQMGVAGTIIAVGSTGLFLAHRENTRLHAELASQTAAASANAAQLRNQAAAQADRAQEASEDLGKLTGILQAAAPTRPSSPPSANASSTAQDRLKGQALVTASTARADTLIREGKPQEALNEYLATYRELRAMSEGGRPWDQTVMSAMQRLGEKFPAALVALRDLRDAAVRQAQETPGNQNFSAEVALLNMRLGEESQTVALLDSMAADDPRRQALAAIGFPQLVAARRYADAMAGKPFASMLSNLQNGVRSAEKSTGRSRTTTLAFAIGITLQDIEVLTGTGQLDEARQLTEKLLSVDDSESTRARIRQHVERAGQSPVP